MSMFFIASLPRTRTYWLAQYFNGLTGVVCHHELLNGLLTKQAFYDEMERTDVDHIGNSDCALYATDFQQRWPDAPTLIVERDIDEVFASLQKAFANWGFPPPRKDILLEQQEALENVRGMRVPYEELNEYLPKIHEYFGIRFNPMWAELLVQANLQLASVTPCMESYLLWQDNAVKRDYSVIGR